ncbi:MAG: YcxB family protein [Weeksellaceae bacterium]|nr:YcxB family protein [Bacteroidota bacterium]MCG2779316.1 YcxB family protein [Weeksellaceae bacterium]
MNFKLSLNQEDYLQYQLYTASKSRIFKRQKKTSLIILLLAFVLVTVNIYNSNQEFLWFAILFFATILILFPFYQRWKIKNYYRKFIIESYKEKIGVVSEFRFDTESLVVNSVIAESKLGYNSFEEINEIADYYFLKLKTGESFIIPKEQIPNKPEFSQFLTNLKKKL